MHKQEDKWIGIYWRPAAAVIYLLICLFDFVLMPVWLGYPPIQLRDVVPLIVGLSPEAQMVVLNHATAGWQPLTLMGGGLFHLSFGAILGAAAWSRGQERIEEMRSGTTPT